MSIPSLPTELVRPIVEHVDEEDTQTLLALASTSRLMKAEAERILYRTFRVSTSISNVTHYLHSYRRRLEESSRLADYITHFHLSDLGSVFMKEEEADALFTQIEIILHMTTRLKKITVDDLGGHPRMYKMLASLRVPLEELRFETQSIQPPIEYERLLDSISTQPQLTTLKRLDLHSKPSGDCCSDYSPCPLPERCAGEKLEPLLQGIRSLGGDGYILQRLLPYCPSTTTLCWYAVDVYPDHKCCVAHACKKLLPDTKVDKIVSLCVKDPEEEDTIIVQRR